MTNGILTDINQSVKLEGIAPGTYRANNQTYYGDNITTVTAQAVAEQSQPMPECDWYACECGRVVDNGKACPDCIADFDKPGQSAYLLNGRLGWLPNEAEVKAYNESIDIDEFMFSLDGLPNTNHQPVITAADWNRGEC